ncbi:hypothetical protein DSO57_1000470 [Entomophthora muscae]|uniref:Uncharacterized protein n=1 Tax=Entomophthora muscae TaxID=34485 RepID=A0ACC2UUG9_9FUNG|nr:hypothetical protein DSO57_1000470 [Entomophthora muscae]
MESPSDLLHMRNLCSLYYPTLTKDCPPDINTRIIPQLIPIPRLNLIPYKCCGRTFYDQNHTLVHYFKVHFRLTYNSITNTALPPFTITALGDITIPIFIRTQLFLNVLTAFPKNPCYFRPAPKSRPPHRFANPYSATLAMAYDFLDMVSHNPPEYSNFTLMLQDYHPVSSCTQVWPFWAAYFYQSASPSSLIIFN